MPDWALEHGESKPVLVSEVAKDTLTCRSSECDQVDLLLSLLFVTRILALLVPDEDDRKYVALEHGNKDWSTREFAFEQHDEQPLCFPLCNPVLSSARKLADELCSRSSSRASDKICLEYKNPVMILWVKCLFLSSWYVGVHSVFTQCSCKFYLLMVQRRCCQLYIESVDRLRATSQIIGWIR